MAYDARVSFESWKQFAAAIRDTGKAAREAEVDISRATVGSRSFSGPASRLSVARANYEVIRRGGGDAEARFDAEVALRRAQRSQARAERELVGPEEKTFGQRAMGALRSSRFGAGGIMPLVGQTADLLGPEAAAIAGSLGFLARNLQQVNQRVGEFRQAGVVSGGGAGDVARAAAAGIRSGEVAAAAASLQERLASDPRAILAAGRIGIGVQPDRYLADPNQARTLNRTLSALREYGKREGPAEQLRQARELGLEQHLDEIRVGESTWRQRMRDADLRSYIVNDRTQASFREYNAQRTRAGEALENLQTVALKPFAAPFETLLGAGATAGNAAAGAANFFSPLIENLIMAGSGLGRLRRIIHPAALGGGAGGSTDENTAALRENTKMIQQGMAGGGERAAAGSLDNVRGQMAHDAAEGRRVTIGAFG